MAQIPKLAPKQSVALAMAVTLATGTGCERESATAILQVSARVPTLGGGE
jgi:hypothetical protein